MSLTTPINRENLGPFWDKPVPYRWLCFCPNFLWFCWSSLVALENSPFKNLWRINCLGWTFVHCSRIHFTLAKIMKKLFPTKNRVFILWLVLQKLENRSLFTIGSKLEPFNQILKKLTFLSTFPTSLRCYAKGNWKSLVCASSKLWIYCCVKKQRYKVLVIFWRLLWTDLQFKGLCWHCHHWETSGSEHNLH